MANPYETLRSRALRATSMVPYKHPFTTGAITMMIAEGPDHSHMNTARHTATIVLDTIPCVKKRRVRNSPGSLNQFEYLRISPPGKICVRKKCRFFKIKNLQTPCPIRDNAGLPTRRTK